MLELEKCRICLRSDKDQQLFSWTCRISSEEDRTFSDLYWTCTKLEKPPANYEEQMPQFLCEDCGRLLKESYNLIQTALRSNNILRAQLDEGKDFEMIIVTNEVVMPPKEEEQTDLVTLSDVLELESNDLIKVEDDAKNIEEPESKQFFNMLNNEENSSLTETNIDDLQEHHDVDDDDDDVQFSSDERGENTGVDSEPQPTVNEKKSSESTPSGPRHPCPYCYLTFKSKYSLRYHMRTIHLSNPELRCDLCPKSFRSRQSMKLHLDKHEEKGEIDDAHKHLYDLMKTNARSLTCAKCGKAFVDEIKLRTHFDDVHINQKNPCNICSLVFSDKKKLIEHLKTHLKVKGPPPPPPTCEKCDKTFERADQLKSHIKKVHEEKPRYLCDVCPATFKELGSLRIHAENHTGRQRKFECEHCEMKFFTKNGLKNHIPKHDAKRSEFKCDKCDKTYFSKSALNTHQKCHSDKFYVCNICQRRCYRRIDLEIHMRSHTGETPHKCNICGRAFKYSHMLHEHLRRHKGIKHVCEICGAEYNNRATLMQHRVKHTGNPLLCGLCNKGFIKKYLLQQHIESAHGILDKSQIQGAIVRKDIRKRTPRRPKAPVPNESEHVETEVEDQSISTAFMPSF